MGRFTSIRGIRFELARHRNINRGFGSLEADVLAAIEVYGGQIDHVAIATGWTPPQIVEAYYSLVRKGEIGG